MEHKSSQPRSAYKGRFGEGSASAHGRPTGSFRTQPSGTYKSRPEYARGGSEYVPARGYTPPKIDRAAETPNAPQPRNPKNAAPKRGARRRGALTGAIIAIAVAAALAIVLLLALGQRAPAHMLPTVTPPEAAADAATEAGA